MWPGRFLLLINRLRVAIKASVVLELTTSRCIAFVARQTKTARTPSLLWVVEDDQSSVERDLHSLGQCVENR